MYEDLKIDDVCLQGKHIIRRRDIINLLPEEIKESVENAFVYINEGQPLWVIYLESNSGGFLYRPFSGEMIYEPYAKKMDFGRIYFWREARYLRWQESPKRQGRKIYTVYICRPTRMYLLKETCYFWVDDGTGPGFCSTTKRFRAFNYPKN